MSDTYIPGVKSKYDTEKLIQGLMKVERIPRDRAEKEIKSLEIQKTTWQDLGRRIGTLRESARSLFSFQNPFNERTTSSSDEAVLTAAATREAVIQDRTFIVKKTAQADRFLSKPLDEGFKVAPGEYVFAIGKDEVNVPFRGGTIKEFTDAVARRGKDKLSISTVSVEPKTKSLVIESLVSGAENRLVFKKDAERLALETGISERSDDGERRLALEGAKIADASKAAYADGQLKLGPLGQARIEVSPPIRVKGELILEADLSVKTLGDNAVPAEEAPTGPAIPPTGSVTYGGITIEGDPSIVQLPAWEKPAPPPRVDDPKIVKLLFSDGSSAFADPVKDDADFQKATYSLGASAAGKELTAVETVNRNTQRSVAVRSLRVYDPKAAGGLRPISPISTAQDAVLSMDGIEVKRKKNDIDDLIPGVTVTLKGSSDKPVKLSVQPDKKVAKDAIIALVGNYDRLLGEINVLTRNDPNVLKDLDYLSDDEKKTLTAKLGTMQGDLTLNQLKSNLQRSAAAPYQTSEEKGLALLAQMGISTDSRKPGSTSGLDQSRLRGYLEIDEKALDRVLDSKMTAVKQIFGSDSDGDLVIDSGFAYAVDGIVKPFVEIGGIVQLKTGTLDAKMAADKKRMDTLDAQLAAKESDLKRKYGQMESSLNSMEATSASIERFGNSGSR